MILKQATDVLDDDKWVYVWYRQDGSHYNHRRLQNLALPQEWLTKKLLSAYEVDLVAHTEQTLPHITSCLAYSSRPYVLEVSLKRLRLFSNLSPE